MKTKSIFSPEPRSALVSQVYKTLKDALLKGKVCPGERLIEKTLAEELNVSRGVCREALRLLEQEGLVERETHRGVRVTSLTLEQAKELHLIRAMLEILAYSQVAKIITTPERKKFDQIIKNMRKFAEEGNKEQVAELDFEMHRDLVRISQLTRLYTIWSGLFVATKAWLKMVVKYDYDLVSIVDSHEQILRCIDNKDNTKIAYETCKHIFLVGNTWLEERSTWCQDMPFVWSGDGFKNNCCINCINKGETSEHS